MYVPARQGFVSSSSAAATASGGPPVDLFFDLEELRVRAGGRVGGQMLGSTSEFSAASKLASNGLPAEFFVDTFGPLWRCCVH